MSEPLKRGPNKRELQAQARRMAADALVALSSIMTSQDGQTHIRLAAAREVLDRGYGRPRIGDTEMARAPADEGFRVVVRQFTDERDDEPAGADESTT